MRPNICTWISAEPSVFTYCDCSLDACLPFYTLTLSSTPGGGNNAPLVFLEVDEGQHRYGYGEAGCDMRRMSKVMESLTLTGFVGNVLWLRYNLATRMLPKSTV